MNANDDRLVRLRPYNLLEAWRGLAALWVALYHSMVCALDPWPESGVDAVSALTLKGQLGVTIFFVISGYCIANAAVSARTKPGPIRSFLTARVRRIYPPYYFSLLLWYGLLIAGSVLLASSLNTHSDLRGELLGYKPIFFLATLTLTQVPLGQPSAIIIYWSLCYEVAFYVIVAAAVALTRRGRDAVPLLYVLHGLTIACLAVLVSGWRCPFPFDLWAQFGLGILAYHLASAARKRGLFALTLLAIGMIVAYGTLHGEGGDLAHPSPRLASYFAAVYTLVLIGLQRFDAAISRWAAVRALAWVGTFSYSLYLTHVPVMAVVSRIARRALMGVPGPWVIVFVQVAAAIVFARIFYAFCERPFMRAHSARPTPAEESPVAAVAGGVH